MVFLYSHTDRHLKTTCYFIVDRSSKKTTEDDFGFRGRLRHRTPPKVQTVSKSKQFPINKTTQETQCRGTDT
jgi:hypothetical protein